jgi:hypothetical protein
VRLNHIARIIGNAIGSSESSCAIQQQGISHFSGYKTSAKITAKTNKPLGTVETRLEVELKKSMTV